MRVLVLGGTGLISTGITRQLVRRGDTVTLFNRGSDAGRGVSTVHGDRADASALRAAWGEGHDVVVDMLCYTPARDLPVDERHEQRPDPAFGYAHDKARCEEILHGDGSSRWAACHRDDVARAFVAATSLEPRGRAYNVTGHEALTFEGYWRSVADALGVDPVFVRIPADVLGAVAPRAAAGCVQNFQYDNVFDCSAAARDLGFESTVPWAEGIARGVAGRTPGPVGERERSGYDAVVAAWTRAIESMRAELLPRSP